MTLESFFLTVTDSVIMVQTFELSHPDFPNPFRFQRNFVDDDLLLTDENGTQQVFKYELFEIKKGNSSADLDQSFSITLADYKDDLKNLIEKSNRLIPINFIYREWRDDLRNEPMQVFETLIIQSVSSDSNGVVTFTAAAEQLNNVKTGDLYTFDAFPLMKGAL